MLLQHFFNVVVRIIQMWINIYGFIVLDINPFMLFYLKTFNFLFHFKSTVTVLVDDGKYACDLNFFNSYCYFSTPTPLR